MAIQPKISSQIILTGAPTTINEWMTKAAEIDSAFKRTNSLFSRGITSGKKKSNWKPRLHYSQQNNDYREPMDIDVMNSHRENPRNMHGNRNPRRVPFKKMSDEEKERRMKNNLCFKCAKPGHFAADCRGTPQEPPPRKEQQKKKFTPSQM